MPKKFPLLVMKEHNSSDDKILVHVFCMTNMLHICKIKEKKKDFI